MSDDKIESFASHRANKSGDCRDWSVLDALRDAIADIESGKLKVDMVYVAMTGETDDGQRHYAYRAAGARRLELVGLLSSHAADRNR